jgi:hypothetical protein
MLQGIAGLASWLTLISTVVSLSSLVVAFTAFRRTSRFQDVDYRPHVAVSFSEPRGCVELDRPDEDEDREEVARQRSLEVLFEGKVANAGPKPVNLLMGRVLLGPRHRDDPELALTVPLYKTLGPGSESSFSFGLLWGTIWDVANHFGTTTIECTVALKVRGADGVVREINRFCGTAMKCEGNEWVLIEAHYFTDVLSDLQQVQLQQRLRTAAKRS